MNDTLGSETGYESKRERCTVRIHGPLLLLNAALIWAGVFISDFIVSINRLDESKGYMLTDAEEVRFFTTHTSFMFLLQCAILIFLYLFLRTRNYSKRALLLNLAVHLCFFLWFVYSVYQSTINGY